MTPAELEARVAELEARIALLEAAVVLEAGPPVYDVDDYWQTH